LLNEHQQAVLDFVRRGSGHAVVEATAGSGKTTTLVMVARLLVDEIVADGQRAAFLAFNRSTAAELRARLPPQVEAVTLHSLGRQVLAHAWGAEGLELEPDKYLRLAREIVASRSAGLLEGPSRSTGASVEHLASYLAGLYGFARLEMTELTGPDAVSSLRARYDLVPPLPQARLPALEELLVPLARAGERAGTIDYTDMIHLPVALRLEVPEFSFICVDEAQDLSRLALGLIERLIGAGARALFVGDPHQAIYAFAGADAGSLARIERATGATRLPLSVSFRCPSKHVVLARRFSPEMRPAGGAPPGAVALLPLERLPREVRAGDMVMARTNAPLPAVALRLAEAGLRVRVLGHDLVGPASEIVTALATGLDHDHPESAVLASAEAERRRLEDELLTSERLPEELERSRQAHAALQLALRFVRRSGRDPGANAVEAELQRRLAPQDEFVLLSTIHKAKGREADRTFLLFPETLGVGGSAVPMAPPDAALRTEGAAPGIVDAEHETLLSTSGLAGDDEAEANVLFVALTRAKLVLTLVERETGALAERLASEVQGGPGGLGSRWNDVLRLASVMSEARQRRGLSSGHGKTR